MDHDLLTGVVVPALPPRGQGGGDGGPGSGGGSGYYGGGGGSTGFIFKNPLAGAVCCDGIGVTCGVGCATTGPAAVLCLAGCAVAVAACYNGQVWPCSLL